MSAAGGRSSRSVRVVLVFEMQARGAVSGDPGRRRADLAFLALAIPAKRSCFSSASVNTMQAARSDGLGPRIITSGPTDLLFDLGPSVPITRIVGR